MSLPICLVFFLNTSLCLNTDGLSEKRNKETEYVNKIIDISEDVKWQMEQIWFCRATAGQVLIFWTMKFRRINYSPKISYSAWE